LILRCGTFRSVARVPRGRLLFSSADQLIGVT
jgi:hypothetical protein